MTKYHTYNWGGKPAVDVDFSVISVSRAVIAYTEEVGSEPIGVIYSPHDHHFIDEVQKGVSTPLLWKPIPGWPQGAFVVYGPNGTYWSPGG